MTLACALAVLMVLDGRAQPLPAWLGMAAGAFLAALPGRIRTRREPRLRSTWQGCAVCFAGGLAAAAAAVMGQLEGRLLPGLLCGSVSAAAFALAAWPAAAAAVWIRERKKRA